MGVIALVFPFDIPIYGFIGGDFLLAFVKQVAFPAFLLVFSRGQVSQKMGVIDIQRVLISFRLSLCLRRSSRKSVDAPPPTSQSYT